MNLQRITVSIPKYLYQDLLEYYGKGNISKAVTEAVKRSVLKKKTSPKDAVEKFLTLRKIAPKRTTKQILDAIHKGRTF